MCVNIKDVRAITIVDCTAVHGDFHSGGSIERHIQQHFLLQVAIRLKKRCTETNGHASEPPTIRGTDILKLTGSHHRSHQAERELSDISVEKCRLLNGGYTLRRPHR
ncbi:hypothetical protein CEXT_47211 [Caerostris extrusa]|uniref:Uncharacterized protein n=1 Tax=Caerostris extrusa TaxID=172846 RepID=A0AAV4Y915_CAEEX|nr:hypothetical protein CEXT_47211 [Caerostris extrusa]